ncbi:MAG: EF-P lysine aminoacylase GenX [Syntrophus sp. (in: bacteria)]|nr:EF-P lysine aminoacylase GenX [Syntrophus sp. (in: bacteria)]
MTMHKKGSGDNKTIISSMEKQGTSGPSAHYDILKKRHELLKSIRRFFYDRGYIEVETANLMKTAPPDPYIDPLKVYIDSKGPFFLHTSPEMGMKKLLPSGHKRIFQVCKVYRVEEHEEIHNTEFTMLEWYREGDYVDAMQETNELVSAVARDLLGKDGEDFQKPFHIYELERLFQEKTNISPFCLGRDELFEAMRRKGFLGIDDDDDLSSLFFKLYVQKIEGTLAKDDPYFIIDWPTLISTMAKEKTGVPGKAERFELYIHGLEIANGYTELLDPAAQRKRFLEDNEARHRSDKETFDVDEAFLESLSMLEGSYTGVSIGVDRLLMTLLGKDRIDVVIPHRFRKT